MSADSLLYLRQKVPEGVVRRFCELDMTRSAAAGNSEVGEVPASAGTAFYQYVCSEPRNVPLRPLQHLLCITDIVLRRAIVFVVHHPSLIR